MAGRSAALRCNCRDSRTGACTAAADRAAQSGRPTRHATGTRVRHTATHSRRKDALSYPRTLCALYPVAGLNADNSTAPVEQDRGGLASSAGSLRPRLRDECLERQHVAPADMPLTLTNVALPPKTDMACCKAERGNSVDGCMLAKTRAVSVALATSVLRAVPIARLRDLRQSPLSSTYSVTLPNSRCFILNGHDSASAAAQSARTKRAGHVARMSSRVAITRVSRGCHRVT
jgi:hypothetical protein